MSFRDKGNVYLKPNIRPKGIGITVKNRRNIGGNESFESEAENKYVTKVDLEALRS